MYILKTTNLETHRSTYKTYKTKGRAYKAYIHNMEHSDNLSNVELYEKISIGSNWIQPKLDLDTLPF